MTNFLKKLTAKENLNFEESKNLFSELMSGTYNEAEIIQILEALTKKGETR